MTNGDNVAPPKCPSCGVTGLDHIISHESDEETRGGDPWFYVVACDKCGHVYGVFVKKMETFTIGPAMPPRIPPMPPM